MSRAARPSRPGPACTACAARSPAARARSAGRARTGPPTRRVGGIGVRHDARRTSAAGGAGRWCGRRRGRGCRAGPVAAPRPRRRSDRGRSRSTRPARRALLTVADRQTSCTCRGRWMITSSHTGPRYASCRKCTSSSTTTPEVVEALRAAVDHVAQHLGGHHDDRRVTVDRVVAGQQPDLDLAVELDEVAVLLVRQRLDRRRVERPRATSSGELDAVLGDDRLAAPGRCRDDDVPPVVEGVERLELEPIEREGVARQDRPVGQRARPRCRTTSGTRRPRPCGGAAAPATRPGSTRSRGRSSGPRGPTARSGHPTA